MNLNITAVKCHENDTYSSDKLLNNMNFTFPSKNFIFVHTYFITLLFYKLRPQFEINCIHGLLFIILFEVIVHFSYIL